MWLNESRTKSISRWGCDTILSSLWAYLVLPKNPFDMGNGEPSLDKLLEYSCLSFLSPPLKWPYLIFGPQGHVCSVPSKMTTSNISPFLPYLPSLFSTIVPFTEFPPSSDSGLCCGIIFLSPVKMCHSDWFSKKANQSITWQDFQGREDAGKRKLWCQRCRASTMGRMEMRW